MVEKINHARTCIYNCNYHIVFSTKYRKPVLMEDVEKRLKEIIIEIGMEKGFKVSQIEVGQKDHVHIFVSGHPKIAPSYIVKMIKGITARKLFIEFPQLKKQLRNGHLWNPSYYIETIGSISEEVIRKYIERQKKDD
ncbi:IS200/IS605 family transposase [Thermodesulfovibrio sp. 1176]|uniref:IS200/IS605 family transposase n=1 Tax=Thermodesulfovibrio sp. 1176 TaxID=3043424 RepID=UPI002482D190|nr:IS200/IS605 family transposase [Thermodesulfovibrio sp. 1176]MDI1472939.1 IS200/IS605 family transposase [Thermodesulfovibrio sp. 1176]